jgi:YceI-like protein
MFYKQIFRCFIIVIVSIFSRYTAAAQTGKIVKWTVEKNSTLRVQGKTNVNSFTCNINEYAKKDTIICINDPDKPISFTGEIQMDILSFNCHSSMITKGLRKTLRADEYPTMTIRFISLQFMPLQQNKIELIKGWVEVQLAGVVKRFELSYSFLQSGSDYLQLNGGRSFRFSDFKLSPPQKLGGLIKIKDDFDVNFRLILRTI